MTVKNPKVMRSFAISVALVTATTATTATLDAMGDKDAALKSSLLGAGVSLATLLFVVPSISEDSKGKNAE